MSYESGMPMHIAGTAMTWASCAIMLPLIPLATLMTLSTSNPGMIDAASGHWKDAAKKVADFGEQLKHLKSSFDSDPKNWDADDKAHFDRAVESYLGELSKVHDSIDSVGGLMEIVAEILFGLCIAVLTIGGIALAIALLTIAELPIPIVGEIAYSAAQTAALTIMEASIPMITSFQGLLVTVGTYVGLIVAFAAGTYGTSFVSLGVSAPDFSKVSIQMPSGPLKS